jgi:dTDP-4-dehydrorhamnose 3,5-epimerase
MLLKIENTKLEQVKVISPTSNYMDFRGRNLETYNSELYKNSGLAQNFIQDNFSYSSQNVLRGIHGDSTTWKLVSCIVGSIYLIVVNNNLESSQYKQWESFELSPDTYRQILIPPNFGNGHLTTSPLAVFHYKQTTNYNRSSQFTIKYNDPNFNFRWPISNPITSNRDAPNT